MHSPIPRTIIAQITAEVFETTLKELRSGSRQRRLTYARFAVWHLLHELRPDLAASELAGVLNKDPSSAYHGIERATQFIRASRDFAERIERARSMITQWHPGVPPAARNVPALRHLVGKRETPSASKIEPFEPSFHGGDGEYDVWFRNSCQRSEERFLRLAMQEHPERVRVPQKEAAE